MKTTVPSTTQASMDLLCDCAFPHRLTLWPHHSYLKALLSPSVSKMSTPFITSPVWGPELWLSLCAVCTV